MRTDRELQLLEELRQLPTGNLADAMHKLGMPSGVLVDGPKCAHVFQPRMAGYACTIQQVPKHQQHPGKTNHLNVFNEIAQKGEVVVIDVGNRKDVCTGGGMFALRSKQRGLAGIVVNGCYRDIADVVRMDFPLFCTGSVPTKSAIHLETQSVNVPVTMGGVQICPGDIIVGDDTGIVVIPIESVEDVIKEAKRIAKIEARMIEYILEGRDYKECRKLAEAEYPEE